MAPRKAPSAEKAVSTDPIDVTADLDIVSDAPAGAPAASGGSGPVGGRTAPVPGTPQGYAAWVVPAPVALAVAPVGSSGYYTGIKVGVDTKADQSASWLGTDGPRAAWPN